MTERTCDYCPDNEPVDGWHVIHDPEGIEGDQRIPCPDAESSE